MTPNLAPVAIMVPVLGFAVWRRIRSQFGRQPIRRGRMVARIVMFAVLGALVALGGLFNPRLLEGLAAGLAIGAALGALGLRLTRFERSPDGSDGYIPNPWIGGLLTALLVVRLVWRFLVVMPQVEHLPPGAGTPPAFGNSPLTLLMLGLLVGYYITYFSGLLVHHRRFERTRTALPSA